MATKYLRNFAVGFLPQTVIGTIEQEFQDVANSDGTTVGGSTVFPAGTTAWDETSGLILGDPGSGIAESGIDLSLGRGFIDKAPLAGSFSRGISDFTGLTVEAFTVSVPFCGSRVTTTTPTSAEIAPIPGLDALLQSLGMVYADQTPNARYTFGGAASARASALVYANNVRVGIRDIRCESMAIALPPGGIPVATFTLAGTVAYDPIPDDFSEIVPDYGEQLTVSAPVVEGVGNIWGAGGPGDGVRGWTDQTLTVTNTIEEVPDSNLTPALEQVPTSRETSFDGTFYLDDADPAFGEDQLRALTFGALEQISWQIGPVTAPGAEALGAAYTLIGPEVTVNQHDVGGNQAAQTVSAIARASAADNELTIEFN